MLALEFVFKILQNSGTVFRTSTRFVDVIKEKLVYSITYNATSTMRDVFFHSLRIFFQLFSIFKAQLKVAVHSNRI